jgi:hypothetical protein
MKADRLATSWAKSVVAELDVHEDRPVISALVVAKDTDMPPYGFWNLLPELNVQVGASEMQRLAFWLEEVTMLRVIQQAGPFEARLLKGPTARPRLRRSRGLLRHRSRRGCPGDQRIGCGGAIVTEDMS